MIKFMRHLTAWIFAAVVGLAASGAVAQSDNCVPRERLILKLTTKYQETRQSIGISNDGSVVEVWASIVTGTWTITATFVTGITCIIAYGKSFEQISEPGKTY